MNKLRRSVALLLSLISLCLCFAPIASAEVGENPMHSTYVVDDLVAMGVNLADYPKDISDTEGLTVLNFLEYGYSALGDFRYYGLYLYVYLPTGETVGNNLNYVQMSYVNHDGTVSDVVKVPLQLMSVSAGAENKNLFYKFKLSSGAALASKLNSNVREYRISGIELNVSGKVKDYPVAQSWQYRGYQRYFGETDERDDLKYTCMKSDIVNVELGKATWFSNTSNLGEDFRWEVSSVYFAISNRIITQYGDINDETSGLVKVEGVYDKYGVNGLIVPDKEWYDKFKPALSYTLHGSATAEELPGFMNVNTVLDDNPFAVELYCDLSFNIGSAKWPYSLSDAGFRVNNFKLLSQGNNGIISSSDFEELYNSLGAPKISSADSMYMGSYLTDIGAKRYNYVVNVDGDLSGALKTYASSKPWGELNWLHKFLYGDLPSFFGNDENLYVDADGYTDCQQIVEVDKLEGFLDEIYKEEYVGSKYFLQWTDYLALKDYCKDKALNNHVYLMRFDVNPYYCPEVALNESNVYNNLSSSLGAYYYEKVVYENFDILQFTFRNSEGGIAVVPVSCDPIDILGSVVPGNNTVDGNPNGYPDDDSVKGPAEDIWEFLNNLKDIALIIVITVGVIIFVVVGALLFNWLAPFLGPFLTWLVGVFGAVFRGLGAFFQGIGSLLFGGVKFVWNTVVGIANVFLPFDLPQLGGGGNGRKYTDAKYMAKDDSRKDAELSLKKSSDNRANNDEKRDQEEHAFKIANSKTDLIIKTEKADRDRKRFVEEQAARDVRMSKSNKKE